jgi:hypothetical protein
MTRARLLAAGIFIEACYLSFYTIPPGPGRVLLFIAVQLAVSLTLGGILWRIRSSPDRADAAVMIAGFALLFRLTLVPVAPVASDDVYRYVWDGRVTLHGFNPFLFAPDDPRLAHLATADLPSRVNFPGMRTPYPALAQCVFLASNFALGPSIPGIKLLLVLADMAAIGLLHLLLRRLNKPSSAVLVYAWSPLPVLYFALDGHVDALAIPLFLAALWFVLDARIVRGMFALAGAALVKVYPLIAAPMVVPPRLRKGAFFTSLIPFLVFGAVSWVGAGGHVVLFESINAFGVRWEFNGAAFTLLYMMLGSNGAAHLASAALIVCWLAGVIFLRRPPLEAVFLAFVGFLFFSPVAHPWYFTWLAVLLVLRWSTATYALLALTALSNIIVYRYQRSGQWTDDPLIVALEYIPFLFLIAREWVRGEFSRRRERPVVVPENGPLDNSALNR